MAASTVRKLKTGHTVEDVSPEELRKVSAMFPMYEGFVRLNPNGWFVSNQLPNILDKLYDFDFKEDDTIITTYAKSGTTWTQEIVWTLMHNPDLNNPRANLSSDERSPHIEVDFHLKSPKMPPIDDESVITKVVKQLDPSRIDYDYPLYSLAEQTPGPRVLKTHLPLDLFPPTLLQKSKVICVLRDPRDIIVSKYHFCRLYLPFSAQGTFDEFLDLFINEQQFYHPFWPLLKMEFDHRDHPNVQLIFFEDLKANAFKEIRKISDFLGIERTDKQIQNVVDHTNFKNMKKRTEDGTTPAPMSDGGRYTKKDVPEADHGFFRSGKSGCWKDKFTDEQIKKVTAWMEKNIKMFPADFRYKP